MCACVSPQHRRDLLRFATRFGTFSAARYLANLAAGITMTQLTGCNGGGGGIPNVLSFTGITSNPTALKPVYLKASGFVSTDSFTLSLLDEYGNPLISLSPIRVGSDGTIVVSLPLNFSGATGATLGYNCRLSLTQNGVTTNSPVVAVADMPDATTYGMSLGQASHDLYIFAEISLGRTLNTLQALSQTPGISIDLTAITQRIQNLLLDTITARNDVDRVMTDPGTTIPISTARDGTPINYTSASTEIQDRIALNYLSSFLPAAQSFSANTVGQHAVFTLPGGITDLQTLSTSITTLSGALGLKSAYTTITSSDSTVMDNMLSGISAAQALVTTGATIVAVGAAALAAPEIAAGAMVAATYSALAGALIGSATIGNDLYDAATTYFNPNSTSGQFNASLFQLGADTINAYANASGVGGLESAALSVGIAAKTVMQSIYSPAISDVALGASGLLAAAGSYAYNDYISSDAATTASAQNVYDSLLPNGFNAVNGAVSVSNSQGTILSALTAVSLTDNTSGNNVWSVADANGAYSLLFPLSNTNFDYSNDVFTIAAIDPYTHATISTAAMNLSGATPETPLNGPNLSGVCTDLDASNPDADDPDCD